jgi:hypothetical protein
VRVDFAGLRDKIMASYHDKLDGFSSRLAAAGKDADGDKEIDSIAAELRGLIHADTGVMDEFKDKIDAITKDLARVRVGSMDRLVRRVDAQEKILADIRPKVSAELTGIDSWMYMPGGLLTQVALRGVPSAEDEMNQLLMIRNINNIISEAGLDLSVGVSADYVAEVKAAISTRIQEVAAVAGVPEILSDIERRLGDPAIDKAQVRAIEREINGTVLERPILSAFPENMQRAMSRQRGRIKEALRLAAERISVSRNRAANKAWTREQRDDDPKPLTHKNREYYASLIDMLGRPDTEETVKNRARTEIIGFLEVGGLSAKDEAYLSNRYAAVMSNGKGDSHQKGQASSEAAKPASSDMEAPAGTAPVRAILPWNTPQAKPTLAAPSEKLADKKLLNKVRDYLLLLPTEKLERVSDPTLRNAVVRMSRATKLYQKTSWKNWKIRTGFDLNAEKERARSYESKSAAVGAERKRQERVRLRKVRTFNSNENVVYIGTGRPEITERKGTVAGFPEITDNAGQHVPGVAVTYRGRRGVEVFTLAEAQAYLRVVDKAADIMSADSIAVQRIEFPALSGVRAEETAFTESLKGLGQVSWLEFGTEADRTSSEAASYERAGQSLILYADDILKNAMVVDLEHTIKNILSKRNILTGGKVILYARDARNAAILGKMIKRADPSVETVMITQVELGPGSGEVKEVDALLRIARAKGAKDILGLIKGPTVEPEDLAAYAKSSSLPIVIVGPETGLYSFAQAISMVMDARLHNGATNGWLMILPPIRALTEDIKLQYEQYLNSLRALVAA